MNLLDLANAMRKGKQNPQAIENTMDFLRPAENGKYEACAMGLALIGMVGNADAAHRQWREEYYDKGGHSPHRAMAVLLDIDVGLVDQISGYHVNYGDVYQVAQWLEEQHVKQGGDLKLLPPAETDSNNLKGESTPDATPNVETIKPSGC